MNKYLFIYVFFSPQGRRFRSRHELRQYFEESGEPFKSEIFDFCLSSKRRSRNSDSATPIVRRWVLDVYSELEIYDSWKIGLEELSKLRVKWRHLYRVLTYIYSLLIEKDICDCRKVSVKLLCSEIS